MIKTIVAEKGVEVPTATRPPGRPMDDSRKQIIQQFLRLEPGDSFFVQDAKRRDLEFLRKPVMALGANIEIVEVLTDEIYQLPGVRTWRRTGLIDEL